MQHAETGHYLDLLRITMDVTGHESVGRMPLSSGLKEAGIARTGFVGEFLQNATGRIVTTAISGSAVVSSLSLSIFKPITAAELHSRARMIRLGRSAMIAEGWVYEAKDAKDPAAYGLTSWVPMPHHPRAQDFLGALAQGQPTTGQSTPDAPGSETDLLAAVGVRETAEGVVLETVHEWIAHPEGKSLRVHGGVLQLMVEAAARQSAVRECGWTGLRVVDSNMKFVQAARSGPFLASATPLSTGGSSGYWRVEIRELGNNDDTVVHAVVRVIGEPGTGPDATASTRARITE